MLGENILKIFYKHQNQLMVDGNRLTFIGSVKYSDVANDIVDLYHESLIEKKSVMVNLPAGINENAFLNSIWNHIKKFIYDNRREPKIIIMNYKDYDAYIKTLNTSENRTEGLYFAMCKVIASPHVDFIEIY